MEKNLLQWSYWLSLVCFLVAGLWKGLTFVGVYGDTFRGVGCMTLYRGGVLFSLIAVTTTCLVWSKSQKA